MGDVQAAQANGGVLVGDRQVSRAAVKAAKRKRKGKGTLGEFDDSEEEEEEVAVGENGEPVEAVAGEEGAPPKKKKEKFQKEYIGPWAGWEGENLNTVGPTVEEYEEQAEGGGAPLNKKARMKATIDTGRQEIGFGQEKSIFHGSHHSFLAHAHDWHRS